MRYFTIPCIITVLSFLCGCQQILPQQPYFLSFSPAEVQTIDLELEGVTIEIIPSEDEQIHISYLDFAGEDKTISIRSEEDSLSISSRRDSYTESITIALPIGIDIEFNAFNTNFNLHDLSGDISIKTVDGDISAKNIEGSFVLRSGRGDITIADSQGDIAILGEHGVISLNSLHGDIDSSNVIGTIQFAGQVLEGDDIFLETDHGAVTATLLDSEEAFINLWTANGTVTCMLPQVETTNITCKREPTSSVGSFQIKTVWGPIKVIEE
jgi:DUF4097 and DUF4098 domain-containing protein YvlB